MNKEESLARNIFLRIQPLIPENQRREVQRQVQLAVRQYTGTPLADVKRRLPLENGEPIPAKERP